MCQLLAEISYNIGEHVVPWQSLYREPRVFLNVRAFFPSPCLWNSDV